MRWKRNLVQKGMLFLNINHKEPTLDILLKEWCETAENARRYDCLISSPMREGAKFTGGVGVQSLPTPTPLRLFSAHPPHPTRKFCAYIQGGLPVY